MTATVNGGRIKCPWKVVYTEDEDDINSEQEKAEKGYTLPEYAFTVECGGANCAGAESEESGQLDVRGWIHRKVIFNKTKAIAANLKYIIEFPDNSTINGLINENGFIDLEETKFKNYKIRILCN